ncbi:RNA polymerase sigma factor [Tundrisphaera lichenicola]|uniref:RNA polymerase sigma factor n=1 Tax=Tundrisphaera lichenicola TaxID=2029860 RepID=UPI003EB7F153
MRNGIQPTTNDGSSIGPIDWASALARHDRWLRTVVAARVGERQAVDEVLQEVSLAAIGATTAIEPTKLAGWLYRLAIHKTLLYRRTMGRRHKLNGRYAQKVRDAGAAAPDPLGWLLLDERSSLIREALGRLSARDAEILLLKYTENWSCRDLAEHLGQTESAIESRLHRARQRLRDELAGSNVIEVPR